MTASRSPGRIAAGDQALSAARDAVADSGGRIIDLRDASLAIVITPERVHVTGTMNNPRQIADVLIELAAKADAIAYEAGQ